MKKYLGASISAIVLLVPAGLVFADNGANNHDQHEGIQTSLGLQTNVIRADNDNDVDATTSVHLKNGIGMFMGQKEGFEKHMGTTTATTTIMGTTTPMHDKDKHDEATSTKSFWQWLFGLPATTTIGDIRTQIGATTTATSSLQTPPVNVGFFAQLLNFFHLGK